MNPFSSRRQQLDYLDYLAQIGTGGFVGGTWGGSSMTNPQGAVLSIDGQNEQYLVQIVARLDNNEPTDGGVVVDGAGLYYCRVLTPQSLNADRPCDPTKDQIQIVGRVLSCPQLFAGELLFCQQIGTTPAGFPLFYGVRDGQPIEAVVVQDVTTADLISNKIVQGQRLTLTADHTYADRYQPGGDEIYISNLCWDLANPVKPFEGQRYWARKVGTYTPTGEGELPERELYMIQGEIQYGYLAAQANPALPIGYPLAERGFDATDPQRSYLIEPVTTGGLLRMKAKVAGVYSIELSGTYQLATVPVAASPVITPVSDWDPNSYGITATGVVSALLDLKTYYLSALQDLGALAQTKAYTGYIQIYKNGVLLAENAMGPFLSFWDTTYGSGAWQPKLYREGGAVVWQGVLAAGDEIGWGGGLDAGTGFTVSVYDVSCEMQYLGPDLSSLFS